jgi:hypothetical protein
MNKKSPESYEHRGAGTSAASEPSPNATKVTPYQAPELHDLGDLKQLQAYGPNYRDGTRYQP